MKRNFPVLDTSRLILRETIQSDTADMLSYLSDSEVVKYMGLAPFQSMEDALDELNWYRKIFTEGSGIRWGITSKVSGKMIGSCGFHNLVSKHRRAEVGFELSRDYWGQGIASEALAAVIQFGLRHFQLERVEALVEPENKASQLLLEAKGFQREGLLRHYEYTCVKFDDLYMYSLLRSDLSKA
ncbi:GNAT family N-acetyltransferase [Rossellomorea vietnamensis]|uniref:GNAT family N-acetyltransferase n=1 Tax=Rossellomorea vietnamensis TaxID=218284 RepID=A0A5D4NR61_9BACI|nr:GNAT family protein [Rossellomorea vietnamensis]TYS16390.1 GNAT family N-acetyltransferase [Rossellomorea vietnamensis]